ncbi:TetR/AcrR family transcriptional regulator [Lactiplantibacillus fabifermentans]|uniref:HTH tetR-type domain-containing protein n=2 Tax=Lactiplantibacillus fabifermentans TaxID=483011 RepID=A0A0R2NDS3_9LACO|nr:TetR/AcrR family transcriptional regulator [Lactiplantibacillus fabifermentans]ETY72722.1 transcriptional regulator [Lactiplantibacillus fabifermentans T30PCM01]KRO22731.1 hypothetical protein DY78_GL001917 [Lactiplantibacillus fabifermentans DSM 21115]
MKVKDEQKYDRLIAAAIDLLAAGGLANFSTTKVAKQAGIPQSNVYIYFKNKQSLLEAVFQATVHTESVAVAAAIDDNAELAEQLAMSIRALYDFALAQPAVVTALQVLTEDVALKQKFALKADDTANQKIQHLLTTGVTQNILQPVDLNLLRYFLTRPIFHYAEGRRHGLYSATTTSIDELVVMVMGAVLQPTPFQTWLQAQSE